ncbi:MAG TPA: diguanylate cyclase, partial [Spirochaetota bacterium]|nr:diguanylate cyclase [Spirochaetota bacterium]
ILKENEDHIIIEITDNGIGIEKKNLEIIFNRFEQIEGGRNSKYRGTGIGLAFSKELITYLKGDIWAESNGPGTGASFFIKLPKGLNKFSEYNIQLNEQLETSKPRFNEDVKYIIDDLIKQKNYKNDLIVHLTDTNDENEFDHTKSVILIIDDDQYVKYVVMEYLINSGYKNFILANNGLMGLDAIYKYQPDIIISDYNMPEMNGDQLNRTISQNPKISHIPIIFISAITDKNLMYEQKKLGASAFLHKPIDEKDLIATVETLTKKYMRYKTVLQSALIDELTGIYNRKALFQHIKEIFLSKSIPNVSIIFCDIDFFKKCNDKYGHQTGDLVLKKVSYILSKTLRGNDIIGRYGGEEFVILLPETSIDQAKIAALKLQSNLNSEDFILGETKNKITMSYGIASFVSSETYICNKLSIDSFDKLYSVKDDNNWEEINNLKSKASDILIELADIALYKAKSTICMSCGFTSTKESDFDEDRCIKCGSNKLIMGRDKIVVYE